MTRIRDPGRGPYACPPITTGGVWRSAGLTVDVYGRIGTAAAKRIYVYGRREKRCGPRPCAVPAPTNTTLNTYAFTNKGR